MSNGKTLNLTIKITEDGSVVLDVVGEKIRKVENNVRSMSISLGLIKLDSMINLGERAYRAGEQIYSFARSMASMGSDVERTAGVLGMSITEFQQLSFAAKMADVEQQQFTIGIRGLVSSMQEAVSGMGPGADAFSALGVSVQDASGGMKPIKSILEELAGKFETYADGPEKLALAYGLFGQRGGEAFIAWLNKGKDAMKENAEMATSLGLTTEEYVKQLAASEEGFKTFETGLAALKMQAAPLVSLIGELLSKWGDVAKIRELNIQTSSTEAQNEEAKRLLTLKTILKEMNDQQKDSYVIRDYKVQTQLNAVVLQRGDIEKKINDIIGARRTEMETVTAPAWVKDWVAGFKTVAPSIADNRKKEEAGLMAIREVNVQLLKDEESTLKRMIDLQGKLNQSSNEAVEIANRLGIQTKAGMSQWINQDMVGEYEKLLGSGLFSGEEMEQFKARYTDALKSAMETAGGKNEFGRVTEIGQQIQDAISRINTMEVKDTPIEKMRQEFEKVRQEAQYLQTFTGQIALDDSSIVQAANQVSQLKAELTQLVNQSWDVMLSVYGSGSATLPISEKINEIDQRFGNLFEGISSRTVQIKFQTSQINIKDMMQEVSSAYSSQGPVVGKTVMGLNQEDINTQIAKYKAQIQHAYSTESNAYKAAGTGSSRYWQAQDEETIANAKQMIEKLTGFQNMLSQAGADAAAQAAARNEPVYQAPSSFGGGGTGDVTVNIGVINVNGENAAEVAEDLDAQLADLYLRDRSKLKNAVENRA